MKKTSRQTARGRVHYGRVALPRYQGRYRGPPPREPAVPKPKGPPYHHDEGWKSPDVSPEDYATMRRTYLREINDDGSRADTPYIKRVAKEVAATLKK